MARASRCEKPPCARPSVGLADLFRTQGCCALGRGTLYLATDQLASLLEVIGLEMMGGVVHADFLSCRAVFGVETSRLLPLRCADLAVRRAVAFGVTNELSAMTPYTVPQAWAAVFDEAGFNGVRYRTRFDTGDRAKGLALFGAAGSNVYGWPVAGQVAALGLRAKLVSSCGISVIDTPRLTDLPAAPQP